jgi:hypothetical protein
MTMPSPIARTTDVVDRLARAESGARTKVCGITDPSEIDLLARQQVDFVGLWHGVPGARGAALLQARSRPVDLAPPGAKR